jgi:hypothetical protein
LRKKKKNQKEGAMCCLLKEEKKMGEQCGEGGLSGWFRRDSPRKKMARAKKGNAPLLKKMKA